jgi:hypothetical protein
MIRNPIRRLLHTRLRVATFVAVPAAGALAELTAMLLLGPRQPGAAGIAVAMVVAAGVGAALLLWVVQLADSDRRASLAARQAAADVLQERFMRADAYNRLAAVIQATLPGHPAIETDAAVEVVTLTDHVARMHVQHGLMAEELLAILHEAADPHAPASAALAEVARRAAAALQQVGYEIPPGQPTGGAGGAR